MVKIIVDIQYFIYNIEFIHKRTIWQRIYNEKQGNKYNGIFRYYGTKAIAEFFGSSSQLIFKTRTFVSL